jgi:hypothetical protein
MWISTNVITNLVSIRFETIQYLYNTLYKSQHISTVLGFLPYVPKIATLIIVVCIKCYI